MTTRATIAVRSEKASLPDVFDLEVLDGGGFPFVQEANQTVAVIGHQPRAQFTQSRKLGARLRIIKRSVG
jgi:hypothetical protein